VTERLIGDPADAAVGLIVAICGVGLYTLNVRPLADVLANGAGVVTVIVADPVCAVSGAGTLAWRLLPTSVVGSGVPFQFTTELATSPWPKTLKVNAPDPTSTLVGDRLVSVAG
jgi:hypothetical protein